MYVRLPTKSFSVFCLIWYVGRPLDMWTSMTLTRSKVKVKAIELLNIQKWHFSRSISSTIFTWGSKLMVDHNSMGRSLQLVGAQCLNYLLGKLSRDFKLCGMSILQNFQRLRVLWSGMLVVLPVSVSETQWYTGSPICIVHADMTLTRSKFKVMGRWPSPFWAFYLQAESPSWCQTNSVKALKA